MDEGPRPGAVAPFSSVGPLRSRDVESAVIPDPEFYDVGRSVSGWYNFGGIPSIRRFMSSRFSASPSAPKPRLNAGGLHSMEEASTISGSTLTLNKDPGFAMVPPPNGVAGRPMSLASGERDRTAFRRRSRLFVFGGLLLVALIGGAIALATVLGGGNDSPFGGNSGSSPVGEPDDGLGGGGDGDGVVRSLAPTQQPTTIGDFTFAPTIQATNQPSASATLPTTPTSAPVANTPPPPPEEDFSIPSIRVERAYTERCLPDFITGECRYQLEFDLRALVQNNLDDDATLTDFDGTLIYVFTSGTTGVAARVELDSGDELLSAGDARVINAKMVTSSLSKDFRDDMFLPAVSSCSNPEAQRFYLLVELKFQGRSPPDLTLNTTVCGIVQ